INTIGNDVAKFLGGNAAFKNGAFTEPTYNLSQISKEGEIKSTVFTDVGKAFTGLDENIKNVNQRIKEVSQGVAQDSLNWSANDKAFVAQHGEGKERANSKITSLQNGDISASSTDAVAGQQLHKLGNAVAQSLGGNAKYEDGKWSAPSFKVKTFSSDGSTKDESYASVSAAFEGVGTSFTNVNNRITNVKDEITNQINNEIADMKDDSLVKKDAKTNLITIGKEVEGSEINIANKEKGDRILSGVKEATQKNEAVNKGQLDKRLVELSNSLQSDESAVVHYDKKDGENGGINYASVTLGKGKDSTAVGLHNVADGQVSTGSHDAINGSQLHTLGSAVATYFGGNAKYEDGKWTGPSFKVKIVKDDGRDVAEQSYDSVAAAFEGIGISFKNLHKEVTQNNTEVSENIKQNALLWSDKDKAFVATHGEKEGEKSNSKIISLKNGDISANSTEAVNGGQINVISQDVAKFLGGDAAFKDGIFTGPTYKLSKVSKNGEIKDAEFKDVGSAFSGLDENIKNVNDRIKDVSESVAQDSLNWNKEAGAFVATHGADKQSSKITSLKNGDISASSTDAVAGQQLHQLGSAVAKSLGGNANYENGVWTAPKFTVKSFKEDGKTEDKDYPDVASAFAGVGTSFANVNKTITDVKDEINKEISQVVSDSLVKQDEKTNLITIGKEVEGSEINIANKIGEARALSGVKKAEKGDEAINKAQLDESLKDLSNSLQSEESAVVLYDKKDDENGSINYESITLGKGKNSASVSLHNVAAGNITKNSRDAINGSQLHSLGDKVASYFGGNAKYENGVWTAPSFKVNTFKEDGSENKDESYSNVAEALAGVGNSITNVKKEITKEINNEIASVQGDALLWDEKKSAFAAMHGKEGKKTNSKITSL
ncbi:hypothetical protein NPX99_08495, partial [Bartonella sp. 220]|nr:hypothetical protein [Bartonella sp. 220B]